MKKSALLRKVSAETGVPYSTVKKVMDSALEHIAGSLGTGERVVLSGFGTFALRPYRARQWVNPQTGQQVDIPAALRPGFVTSAALKRRLAGAPHGSQASSGESSGDGAAMGSITTRSRRAATSMRQVRTRKHGSQTAQMNNGK
jgi:DNA-binding protein HU-beta